MKMKNKTANQAEKVLEFIKENPGSTIETITEGANISNLLVRKAVKELQEGNLIVANDEDGGFTLVDASNAAAEVVEAAETTPVAEKATRNRKKIVEELGPKTFTGRNNDKYRFGEHRNLPKGRLVLAIVRAYVDKNPKVSLTKLQEVFHSDEIQPRFGVIMELSAAKKFSKNKVDRHFVKNAEDIIKLANGTKIAVCNQWTAEGLTQLLKVTAAHPMGFKVKVEEAAE